MQKRPKKGVGYLVMYCSFDLFRPAIAHCLWFLSILCTSQFSPSLAYANDTPRINTSGRVLEIDSPFLLNNQRVGSVLLSIATDDILSVETAGLVALLESRLSKNTIDTLRDLSIDERLTSTALDDAGFALSFDMAKLSLKLDVPENALREREISLLEDGSRLRDLTTPQTFSGYLNLRARANVNQTNDLASQTNLSLDTQARFRVSSVVLDNESRFLRQQDSDGQWRRQASRVLMDLPSYNTRIAAGDVFWLGRTFQSSLDILGVRYGRDFNLSPGRNVRPLGQRQFTLAEPSVVSVLIDGNIVRRFELDPGRYDLRDIPLATGSNNIELQVVNASGQSEVLAFNQLFDFDLLAIGESDFAVTAGVLAQLGTLRRQYNEDEPAFAGYYRRGILNWLTTGVAAQATRQAAQLGIELSTATSAGPINTRLGLSRRRDATTGYAIDMRFDSVAFNATAIDLSIGYTSEEFDTVDGVPGELTSASANPAAPNAESAPVVAWRGAIGASAQLRHNLRTNFGLSATTLHASDQTNLGVSLGISGSIRRARSLTWSIRAIGSQQEERETGVSVSLSYRPIRAANLRSSYESLDGNINLVYRQRSDRNRIGGYALEASARTDREGAARGGFQAGYTGNRYLADFDYIEFRDSDAPEALTSSSANFAVGGALVMAGRQLALSRPVQDSFAIVKTHSTLKRRSLTLNPSSRGNSASTDFLGPAVQPSLGRYSQYTLGFDVDNLPLGYDLGAGLFRMSPPLGAGYLLTVGSAATVTVIGVLVSDTDNEPLTLTTGKVWVDGDLESEPIEFFTNRVGKFAVSGIGPGEHLLVVDGSEQRQAPLVVPDDGNTLLRLEELRIP